MQSELREEPPESGLQCQRESSGHANHPKVSLRLVKVVYSFTYSPAFTKDASLGGGGEAMLEHGEK